MTVPFTLLIGAGVGLATLVVEYGLVTVSVLFVF